VAVHPKNFILVRKKVSIRWNTFMMLVFVDLFSLKFLELLLFKYSGIVFSMFYPIMRGSIFV
jgi:hypothetical protein